MTPEEAALKIIQYAKIEPGIPLGNSKSDLGEIAKIIRECIDSQPAPITQLAQSAHKHKMITSSWLRSKYAEELNAFRKNIPYFDRQDAYWHGVLFGLESGFWTMQRAIK